MLLIPAIDLKDGHCVRLRQGDMENNVTVFSDDPVAMVRHWIDQGARRLHIVDLNGARSGKPVNETVIRKMIKAAGDVPVQLGGGIRDMDTIERYMDDGVSFIVIGTAAVKNPGFLHDACTAFAGHVVVSLDAKDGKVATDGWSKLTGHDVSDLAKKFEDYGAYAILYTDIGRDGMMTGVNLEATVALARHVKIPIIASGGIASVTDIEQLCAVEEEGIEAAILGRSLYEGAIDFRSAQDKADALAASEVCCGDARLLNPSRRRL